MVFFKLLVVLILPWLGFYLGDLMYGSSQLFSHHPCHEAEYDCLKLDIMSFGLKGFLFGALLAMIPKLGNLIYLAVISSLLLSVLLVLRLSAFSGAEIITNYQFILSVPVSFLSVAYISHVAVRKIAVSYNKQRHRTATPPVL